MRFLFIFTKNEKMVSEKGGEHAARTMKKKIGEVPECRSATVGGDGGGFGGQRLKY
jgi:hypothetical protein